MSQKILPIELPGGVTFEMVWVEGGTFMMGSEDKEAYDNEKPVHKVTVFTLGNIRSRRPCGKR
ncbi:MAG: SUMF1/EgtB/PvdO family nonheme iron enzyme [Saprospirales bacterium]|nr:SUMF1/EgtB/PvdO family nonheme iron enzyme [Saprospirales bacterium]